MTIAFSRGDHVELARALVDELGGDGEVVGDLGTLHAYDGASGVWRPVPSTETSKIVQSFAGAPTGAKASELSIRNGDIYGARSLAYDRAAVEGYFRGASVGVAFSDGFARVSAQGVELVPHDKEHRCRYALPFDFPAGVTSDRWERFLGGLFRDDADAREKIDCLAEFFGASLLGLAPKYQRAIVATGGGENGKSTLGDIVTAAFPREAVCSIAPQDMGQEYRRAMLSTKRLNIVNELPEATIIASESLKAIVTGDLIVGRHIREAPFTFRPEAGHYFAANKLPGTNDQTEGFWRRLLLVEFHRSFRGDPERDPDIATTIIREDLPAVLSWMLAGASRLMRQGKYTVPSSHTQAIEEWRRTSDPVAMFVAEKTTPDESAATGLEALYLSYRTWCSQNGHRNPVAKNTLGQRLRLLGSVPAHTRQGNVYRLRLAMCEGL